MPALTADSAAFSLSLFSLISHFRTLTPLSSRLIPALLAPVHTLVINFEDQNMNNKKEHLTFLLLRLLSVPAKFRPGSPHFPSSSLKKFKRALSNRLLRYCSTIFPEPLFTFLPFDLLLFKIKHKQTFDTVFITSYPLVSNNTQEEFD